MPLHDAVGINCEKSATTENQGSGVSGHRGKVVALHAAVARSIPLRCTDLYYARGAQGVLPMRVGGCDQSIGSTVSDALVRSWLWFTAARSSPVGCFSTLLQVVDY